ncbi:MAG: AsmA family protein [Rhizobacter sp.]
MKVALGFLIAFALLWAAFDWNWFRPSLERYLSKTSRRTVQLSDLHLGLDAALQPTVRLRGIRIQNAPWADARPFAIAGEARFTFSWASLFDDVRVVTHLVLVDADIDLERQADGLRNWRLTQPDDRGPGRVRVLSLEAHNSRLRVRHQGLDLELQTSTTPLPERDGSFTQRVEFSGKFHGAPFAGDGLTGPVLSLQRTGQFFALRGQAQSGPTRLKLDGRMADLLQLTGLDAHLQLSGASLSQLASFLPALHWPSSKPYRAEALVTKNANAMAAKDLHFTMGSSDLSGEADYDKRDERSVLHANLQSERISQADVAALVHSSAGPAAASSSRLLPQSALPLTALNGVDGKIEWHVRSLQFPSLPAAQSLHARATLDNGLLQVSLLDSELAEGRVNGQLSLDNRAQAPAVRLALRAHGVRLEKLWPGSPRLARVEGPLNIDLKLNGRGQSVADWAGSVNGQASLAMEGGSLSHRLDAKLGLNAGKLLSSFFVGDRQVPIRCGAFAIDFVDGKGTTRQLVLDTEQTHIQGEGSLLLRDESWAVLLTPQAHHAALALNASVLVKGSFRDFSYALAERRPASSADSGACSKACAASTAAGCG